MHTHDDVPYVHCLKPVLQVSPGCGCDAGQAPTHCQCPPAHVQSSLA